MFVRTSPVRLSLACLALIACGCVELSRLWPAPEALPAPAELASPVPGIEKRIERVVNRGLGVPAEEFAARLRAEVDAIARERGSLSLARAEAVLHAGIALAEPGSFAEAKPFLVKRLELCERLLGELHRETAFALADLGVVEDELAGDAFSVEAESLFRRSLAVRSQVLGEAHDETAGSKLRLAALLTHAERRDAKALAEAGVLADEASAVFAKPLPDPDTIWAREVAGHVALLAGDPAHALEILEPVIAFSRSDFFSQVVTLDAHRSYVRALRALGRDADALEIERQLPSIAERSGASELGD